MAATEFWKLVAELGKQQEGRETRDVLNKALDLQRAGRLTAFQVAKLEALAGRGKIPWPMRRAVLDAADK